MAVHDGHMHMLKACRRSGSTREGLGRAALQGLKGSLQQQALLCIHGLSLRLCGVEEDVIKELYVIHKAPKALVGRKGLVPANVCPPPIVSIALAQLFSGNPRQLPSIHRLLCAPRLQIWATPHPGT